MQNSLHALNRHLCVLCSMSVQWVCAESGLHAVLPGTSAFEGVTRGVCHRVGGGERTGLLLTVMFICFSGNVLQAERVMGIQKAGCGPGVHGKPDPLFSLQYVCNSWNKLCGTGLCNIKHNSHV